jgi:hypothetical protein
MKKVLLVIILLFSIQNYSYAKLIEFEKCYQAKHVLKEDGSSIEDINNIKWREDFYNLKNTHLYVEFNENKLDKIIKIFDDEEKLIDMSVSFNFWLKKLNNKDLKFYLKLIKEYKKQGFKEINYVDKDVYSINSASGIITRTVVLTDDLLASQRHSRKYYLEKNKRIKGDQSLEFFESKKFENFKYKIDNFSGGLVQATEILSPQDLNFFIPRKIVINFQNNIIMTSELRSKSDRRSEYFENYICKSTGSKSTDSYTKYWWAAVLIAAVIFFIYTQTKSEISDSNKKEKSNLLKSFFVFFKKKIVRKNKIIIKEKKIEQKKPLKSENLLIKFLEGKESLAYSFWFMYSVLTTLNEIIRYILRANDLLFAAGLYFVFQWCYFIFATIGTWKSATNYKINKVSKNEGAGWATAVYVYLAISLASSIFRTIKSLG